MFSSASIRCVRSSKARCSSSLTPWPNTPTWVPAALSLIFTLTACSDVADSTYFTFPSLQLPVSVYESVIDIISGEVILNPRTWDNQFRRIWFLMSACLRSRPPCCLRSWRTLWPQRRPRESASTTSPGWRPPAPEKTPQVSQAPVALPPHDTHHDVILALPCSGKLYFIYVGYKVLC